MRDLSRTLTTRAAMAAALLMPVSAFAVAIPVVNHSFEDPYVGGAWQDDTLDDGTNGWISSNPHVLADPDNGIEEAGSATYVEDSFVDGGGIDFVNTDGFQYGGMRRENGFIYQDLGVAWQANTTYTVDLLTAHRSGYNHGRAEWGLMSSDDIGTDIGTPGFADIQGIWTGTDNPDADDVFDTFRSGAELSAIGSGALGDDYVYNVGNTAPTGNVVVYIRLDQTTGDRINFDNITVETSPFAGLVGDTDGDGDIDDFDLINAIVAYTGSLDPGVGGKTIADGDTDNDQDVDDFDLINMIVGYTGSLSAPAVPEPGSVALLGLGGLAMLRRRRS